MHTTLMSEAETDPNKVYDLAHTSFSSCAYSQGYALCTVRICTLTMHRYLLCVWFFVVCQPRTFLSRKASVACAAVVFVRACARACLDLSFVYVCCRLLLSTCTPPSCLRPRPTPIGLSCSLILRFLVVHILKAKLYLLCISDSGCRLLPSTCTPL